jgi:hypothetical protein
MYQVDTSQRYAQGGDGATPRTLAAAADHGNRQVRAVEIGAGLGLDGFPS